MNKNKEIIRAITEGAIYVAIYGLIALLTRFVVTATDSMLYYFLPLPISIYAARQKIGYSVACVLASIVLAFLFTNYIYVLTLFIPNIIIGFIFGVLNVKCHNRLINYVVIFILMLGADFLSVYAYELITKVGYFDDMIDIAAKILKFFAQDVDSDIITKIVKIAGIAVLLVDSIVKEILTYLLFTIIVVRLKLVKDYKLTFQIPLVYNFIISLVYLAFTASLFLLTKWTFIDGSIPATIFLVIVLTLHFMLGIYLIYQFAVYIRFKIKNQNKVILIIIILLCFLLFPISILYSLVLNFINYDLLKRSSE